MRHGSLEAAHMEDFVLTKWFDLRLGHGNNGDGFADGVEYFQTVSSLVTWRAGMSLNYGGDITTA